MSTYEGHVGINERQSRAGTAGARARGRAAAAPRGALIAIASLALLLALVAVLQTLPGAHVTGSAHRAVRSQLLGRGSMLSLPLSAQVPASAAIGRDDAAYRVSASGGDLQATNPAQHLRASFSSVVTVTAGATHLDMSLLGAGFGASLEPVAVGAPTARANRVLYADPRLGLQESYANGPLGIEQEFTIAKAPASRAAGPLTLAIALSTNARPTLARGGQSVAFTRSGATVLRYRGLSASDARGRALHSWIELRPGRVLLFVDANHARYPLRIDPFIQLGKVITDEGAFGTSVALSSNGSTAIVGAPTDNDGAGEAVVFTRSGSTWTKQAELTSGEEEGTSLLGTSVALSSNGNIAFVGAPGNHSDSGAAFAFARSGEKWAQQGTKITGSGGTGSPEFGYSVALSAEGTTALVGGPHDGESGVPKGAAWMFTRSGEKWTQQGEKLTASGEYGEGQVGWSVALSANGDVALLGAPFEEKEHCPPSSNTTGECGAVWTFIRSGEKWTQGEHVVPSGETGEGYFGWSIALSSEGTTALIGAPHEGATFPGNCERTPAAPECEGAAFAFTRTGEKWTQQQRLTGSGETKLAEFGAAVALTTSGSRALIGGPRDNERTGAAWEFAHSSSGWAQVGSKITGTGGTGTGSSCGAQCTDGGFGASVALSTEGNLALLGRPLNNDGAGAVWFFEDAAETEPATEVKPTSATLNGVVNPGGKEVTECKFEYGTTTAYGSSAACSSKPGSGEIPVAVSAPLSGLAEDATYHFRVSVTNSEGTRVGNDEQFTTLQTSATGTTKEEAKPAEATDGPLTTKASGGTGTITVGQYGTNPGGARLFGSSGKYVDDYRGTQSTFSKIEFKDCELNGGKTLDWFNPQANAGKGEWVLVSRQTYIEGTPPCVKVEVEATGTSPTVTQMTGTRFGTRFGTGENPAKLPEFGRCATAPTGKQGPEGLFSAGTCLALDEGKSGEPEGKYEWELEVLGKQAFTTKLTTKSVTLESANTSSKVTCTGESSGGEYVGQQTVGGIVLTLTGCAKGTEKCASSGESAGTILSKTLEGVLGIEKAGATAAKDKVGLELFPDGKTGPFAEFSCGSTSIAVRGAVIAPIKPNKMELTQAIKVAATKGKQKPEKFENGPKAVLEESIAAGSYEQTGLSVAITQTNKEKVEVNSVF
jgi:hypothetical protein